MLGRLRKPKIVEKSSDKMKTAVVHATGPISRVAKSPDEALGELFSVVQQQQIFPDGMTFIDMIPKERARVLAKKYLQVKDDPNFSLEAFVHQYFYEFTQR